MTRCRTCGAPIVWAVLPSGRRMPVDRDPSPAGQIRLETDGETDGETDRRAVVLNAADASAARHAGEALYLSHFATCPDADGHRHGR